MRTLEDLATPERKKRHLAHLQRLAGDQPIESLLYIDNIWMAITTELGMYRLKEKFICHTGPSKVNPGKWYVSVDTSIT